MTNLIHLAKHKWKHCIDPECSGCMLCRGGLGLCTVCGGMEGSLPTDCPGERMHEVVENEVYAGQVDYRRRDGWLQLKQLIQAKSETVA